MQIVHIFRIVLKTGLLNGISQLSIYLCPGLIDAKGRKDSRNLRQRVVYGHGIAVRGYLCSKIFQHLVKVGQAHAVSVVFGRYQNLAVGISLVVLVQPVKPECQTAGATVFRLIAGNAVNLPIISPGRCPCILGQRIF